MRAHDKDGGKTLINGATLRGMTRRRFLTTAASATSTIFFAKTSAIAQGVKLLASKPAAIDWDSLKKAVKGNVVTSNASDFAAMRSAMVWNEIKPNRSPDVIVTVKDDDDVVAAIKFARENGLKVVVHGGGHTWCGLAVRNGGMTIDLSELTQSTIDKAGKKASIQPVISNRDLAKRLGAEGLAFPTGHCPTVKASGYLLNGGMSWNMGHWGPACFSIEAIEFVTADGKKVKASKDEHADLFWAARGCGPGMFAVATRYHLKCYDLPKAMMNSTYYFHLDDLEEVTKEVVDIGWHKMPDKIELSVFMIQAPPDLRDKCQKYNGFLCMIAAVAFTDTKEEGDKALDPLEHAKVLSKCLKKEVKQDTSFDALAEISGAAWPEKHRNLCENQGSNADPVKVVMALRDKFASAPSKKSVIVFCQGTGGHNLVQTTDEVALSMNSRFYGGIWSIWEKPEDDAANQKCHDEMAAILEPFTSHHYVGETDIVQDERRAKKSYTPEKWKKLEEIRAKYDPNGVFFGFTGGLKKA